MRRKIVVGIDGTGPEVFPGRDRNRRYMEAFKDSHVSKICRGYPNKRYLMGPVMLGGGLPEAIAKGVRFVERNLKIHGSDQDVLLTGYSRGGLGAIVIAKELEKKKINVKAIMLFDAVDRHLAYDGSVIPRNVGFVKHVIRDPLSSSRESFSNDGMRYYPPTVFPAAYKFMCTHGAMGGMPWSAARDGKQPTDIIDEGGIDGKTRITYRQDEFMAKKVWRFCEPFMKRHGFIQ